MLPKNGIAATVGLGLLIRHRCSALRIGAVALTGSVLFFVVTNFGVWLTDSLYPKTAEGLIACYVAAVPFFGNTLAGNAIYTSVLFGGFALAQRREVTLREDPSPVLVRT